MKRKYSISLIPGNNHYFSDIIATNLKKEDGFFNFTDNSGACVASTSAAIVGGITSKPVEE